jgi:hypothetical protein
VTCSKCPPALRFWKPSPFTRYILASPHAFWPEKRFSETSREKYSNKLRTAINIGGDGWFADLRVSFTLQITKVGRRGRTFEMQAGYTPSRPPADRRVALK